MAVSVLDHDNRGVNQDANRQCQATERHDVRTDMQVVHGDKRGHDSHGKRDDGNQCGTKVEEENSNYQADDDCLLDQVTL